MNKNGSANVSLYRDVRGFTLLEVFAAVAMLGIALTAIFYGQAQGIRAQARMQNVTLATLKASEMAIQTFTDPANRPMTGESDEMTFDPPYDFFHGTRTVDQHELVPLVNEINLEVSWDSGSGDRTGSSPSGKGSGTLSVGVCFYVSNL